jgi:prevent-host-death family protein
VLNLAEGFGSAAGNSQLRFDTREARCMKRRRGLSSRSLRLFFRGASATILDEVEQLFYTARMVRIGVRELNQRTSQVLERVRRGETVIVTDHGEPVARLVPIGDTTSVLDELIGAGKAIPPRFKGPLPPAVAFGEPSDDSTGIVSELRDEA